MFFEVQSPDRRHRVVIEDDGRVAYAYMLDGQNSIVADLWLYNRCPAPAEPEWDNPNNAPFANPSAFVSRTETPEFPASTQDLFVKWSTLSDATVVEVFLKGQWIGKLKEGMKPGWARFAKIDGPLALAMAEDTPI